MIAGGPWTSPTYADSTDGDNIDGEDLDIRRAAVESLGQYNGSVVVVVCSMARTATASVRVIPQRVPPGIYKAGAAIDTALEHKSIDLGTVTLDGKTAIELTQLPPYSMAILRFEKP